MAGSLYALVALGYSLIYSVLGIINFAHGELLAVGVYLCWFLGEGYVGFCFPLAAAIAVFVTGLVSLGLGWFILIPASRRAMAAALVSAVGLSMLIQNGLATLWSSEAKPFYSTVPYLRDRLWSTDISLLNVGTAVLSLVLLYVVWFWFLKRTDLGLVTRACASNPEVAHSMGMNFNRVLALVFFLSGVLAAVSGIAVGLDNRILVPTMGMAFGLRAFIASVIGGVRSFRGAVAGSFVLGLVENLVPFALLTIPGLAFLTAFVSKDTVAMLLLVGVLFWRHRGLFAVPYEARP